MGRLIHFRALTCSVLIASFCGLLALTTLTVDGLFGLIGALVLSIISIYIALRLGNRFYFIIVPLGMFFAGLGLLYFIDAPMQKFFFGLVIAVLYYLALLGTVRLRENKGDSTAHSFYSIATIGLIFLIYAVYYAFYINFQIALWFFLLLQFFTLFCIILAALLPYDDTAKRPVLYSILLSFAMTQVAWIANFWPFGYLSTAGLSLVFFYVLLDMTQMMFTDTLSKKRTLTNISFAIVLLCAVLLTTRWVLLA